MEEVTSLATNSTIVVSASIDGTCRLWKGTDSSTLLVNSPIRGAAVSESIVATMDDSRLIMWTLDGNVTHTQNIVQNSSVSHRMSFSSDGLMLCTASGAVIDVSRGKQIYELPQAIDVCFHGPNCVAMAKDKSVVVDVRSKTPVCDSGPAASRLAWCKDSIGCLHQGELSFWSLASRQVAETELTNATCIAGDERSFVVGDANGCIHTWGEIRKAPSTRGADQAHIGLCGDAIDTAQLPTPIATTLSDMMSNLRALNVTTSDLSRRLDITQAKLAHMRA